MEIIFSFVFPFLLLLSLLDQVPLKIVMQSKTTMTAAEVCVVADFAFLF